MKLEDNPGVGIIPDYLQDYIDLMVCSTFSNSKISYQMELRESFFNFWL